MDDIDEDKPHVATKENGEVNSHHSHIEGSSIVHLVANPASLPEVAADPPPPPAVDHVPPPLPPLCRLSRENSPSPTGSPISTPAPPISSQDDVTEQLVTNSSPLTSSQVDFRERLLTDSNWDVDTERLLTDSIEDDVTEQFMADSNQADVTERLVTDSSSENGSSLTPHAERIGRPASVGRSIGAGDYTQRENTETGDFWTWLLAGLLLVLLWAASTTEPCDEHCKVGVAEKVEDRQRNETQEYLKTIKIELVRLQKEVAVLQEEAEFLAQRVGSVVQVVDDEALTTRELFETHSLQLKQVYEPPEIAIMTILKDESSFGEDRNISQYFDLLDSIQFPANRMSLNILVSDHGFLGRMEREMKIRAKKFRKRSLFFRDFGWSLGRSDEERHDPRWQKPRRSMLARYRNVLLQLGLKDEAHVLWVDGDMEYVPPNIVDYLRSARKDIITPRCLRGDFDYDLNTWRGPRLRPRYKYQYTHAVFVPRPSHLTEHMDKLAQLPDDFVRVDSVGGTVLLVKSEVHINGALFPPFYVVGSFWDTQGGFDGIETEGLCYVAATMDYSCWGAPKIMVYHHDS